jgi:hypothetical protein
VSRFWAGFAVASLVWMAVGAALVLFADFGPPPEAPPPDPAPVAAPEPIEEEEPSPTTRRRRPRTSNRRDSEREATPSGEATTGDLGEDAPRTLDMGAESGERQLSSAQIESTFDAGMGRIRRCLVLMAGDDPVSGRLTFALRIGSDGQVRNVQLSGPAAATTGEAGDCLRTAARGLRFPSFDGPEMVVRYPLDLE